jgi:hypothetical protein
MIIVGKDFECAGSLWHSSLTELDDATVSLYAEHANAFVLGDGNCVLLIVGNGEFDDVGQSRRRFCCGLLLLCRSFVAVGLFAIGRLYECSTL